MRVAVVTEFYPRAADPVLGVWAHRQALATRAAGAEVVVFVLHRVVPPRSDMSLRSLTELARQPPVELRDGLEVHYLSYVSPPRPLAYASWGAWAALPLRAALARHGPFDVLHAHNAVPAGDGVLKATRGRPLVVSVHGGDVLWTAGRVRRGRSTVARVLSRAELVLANSAGIAQRAQALGATRVEVMHLGAELPAPRPPSAQPLLVTVGHLVPRKRHVDVLEALARLPADVRYLIIGDGPSRADLVARAAELGLSDRVEFVGQLSPADALERSREAWLFVMPSVDEAFGVAYVEAMAAGIPAIGARGEPGPEEIRAEGGGLELVPPRDPAALAARIAVLLNDPEERERLGGAARDTVGRRFSWERCGEATVAAYRDVLGLSSPR